MSSPFNSKTALGQRGISFPPSSDHDVLMEILQNDDLEKCKYLKYNIKELQGFVKERNLWPQKKRPHKQEVIDILQRADESARFSIMDLSPEVRQMIYRFAIAKEVEVAKKDIKSERDEYLLAYQMRFGRLNPKQPAITRVSKLVRQEALPLFYRENSFVVGSVIRTNHSNHSTRVLCANSFAFLKSATDQNHLDIRNIDVLVYNPLGVPPPAGPAVPAAPIAAAAAIVAPNGTLPIAKLNFSITLRRVPASNDPIVLMMRTTVGPNDMVAAMDARLTERHMSGDDLICSLGSAFLAPANARQGEVSLGQITRFIGSLGPDITGLQLDCCTMDCPYHTQPAVEGE